MNADLVIDRLGVARDGVAVLREISLQADGGEFIGVVGPNGAGKSTLLRAIVGIEPPLSGACLVNNQRLSDMPHTERARLIAYLPQLREVYWRMTVEQIVALGRYAFGAPGRLAHADREAVDRAIAAAGVEAFRNRPVSTLSGGEQARAHLARALAGETPVLIADEPTAALDPRHQLAVMSVLKARAEAGALVIAALHDLDLTARYCSRIVVLSEGRLAADAASGKALRPEMISRVFGVEAQWIAAGDGTQVLSFHSQRQNLRPNPA